MNNYVDSTSMSHSWFLVISFFLAIFVDQHKNISTKNWMKSSQWAAIFFVEIFLSFNVGVGLCSRSLLFCVAIYYSTEAKKKKEFPFLFSMAAFCSHSLINVLYCLFFSSCITFGFSCSPPFLLPLLLVCFSLFFVLTVFHYYFIGRKIHADTHLRNLWENAEKQRQWW